MRYELKKVELWSVLKISLLIHLLIGIVLGLMMAGFFALIFSIPGQLDPYSSFGNSGFNPAALGVFGGILIGLFYGFIIIVINGLIVPLILVLLYNLFAAWVGGVRLNFTEVVESHAPVNPPIQPSQTTDNTSGGNI